MINRKLAVLSSAGLLVLFTACGESSNAVQKKSESTTQSSDGTVKTTSESKQVGTTLEAKSETKTDTPSGVVNAKTETFVGTVTIFEPGQKIEVLTGEKTTHTFKLDEKSVVYSVDSGAAVGKRVSVTDETGSDQVRHLTVKIGG